MNYDKGKGRNFLREKTENNGENIVICIKDNGGGIRIEPKERIFEPFLSTKEDGTGIGLWITKRLCEYPCPGKLKLLMGDKTKPNLKSQYP